MGKLERTDSITGMALVTPYGIEYAGRRYGCRKAVKEGWFLEAREGTGRTLLVRIDREEDGQEWLYIVEPASDEGEANRCYPLSETAQGKPTLADRIAIEVYQQQFRRLREEWKRWKRT